MDFQYRNDRSTSFGRLDATRATTLDAGLRTYMLRIYNTMAGGLALTGVTSWLVANTPVLFNLFYSVSPDGHIGLSLLGMIAVFSPLALVFFMGMKLAQMKATTARNVFFAYSVLMGISLSTVFLAYTAESITRTFFITAGTFAGVSLWAYTTRRDLTGVGHFVMMGLFGLVIASLVSLFFHSSALQFAISVVGVIVFTGLTAWDTQRFKEMYAPGAGAEANARLAVLGALNLYMDFINLFLYLLRFMGRRD